MENRPFRKHIQIAVVFILSGWAIALLSIWLFQSVSWLCFIGLTLVIAGILWRLHFVKCPHCADKLLGCRVIPKYCPNCGKELDE